jgi:hypothetical protein
MQTTLIILRDIAPSGIRDAEEGSMMRNASINGAKVSLRLVRN